MALQSGASFAAGFREFNGVYLCGDTLISKVDEPDAALVEKNLQYLQALSDRTDLPVYFEMCIRDSLFAQLFTLADEIVTHIIVYIDVYKRQV